MKEKHINEFFTYINAQHHNVQFTVDLENEVTLLFLDINITRDNDLLSTTIYRKPTLTGLTS